MMAIMDDRGVVISVVADDDDSMCVRSCFVVCCAEYVRSYLITLDCWVENLEEGAKPLFFFLRGKFTA